MLPGGQEVDKPAGWRRLAAALYYCGASMAVQTVNKVGPACTPCPTSYNHAALV